MTIFHDFLARCSTDEAIQFLPPSFLSKLRSFQLKQPHDCPWSSPQPQNILSIPNALHNVSNFAHMIVAGGTNSTSCKPSASISCLQSRPRHNKQAVALTFSTPKSFKEQERQYIQPSVNASKLIRFIEGVARKGLRESEFYGEDIQAQSHITDPLHR